MCISLAVFSLQPGCYRLLGDAITGSLDRDVNCQTKPTATVLNFGLHGRWICGMHGHWICGMHGHWICGIHGPRKSWPHWLERTVVTSGTAEQAEGNYKIVPWWWWHIHWVNPLAFVLSSVAANTTLYGREYIRGYTEARGRDKARRRQRRYWHDDGGVGGKIKIAPPVVPRRSWFDCCLDPVLY